MTHRSTIVTRVHTREGIVGEAYAGDEDAGLFEIEAIVHEEIAPVLAGHDAFAVERCWELARPSTFDILRDRRLGLVACAGVDAAIWDAIGKALGQPLWRLWGGYGDSVPMISIGGYYDSPMSIAEEIALLRERGLAGMKFKVGGLSPGGRRRPLPRGARGGRPRLRARRRRQPGLDARAGDPVRPPRRGLRPALLRGAVPLAQRPPRDARRPPHGRGAHVRGPERVLRLGLPRPDGRGRDRRLQLRRLLVRRPDRVAPRRGDGARVRRGDGPPRGAAGRRAPARRDPATARSSSASTPTATRSGGT